MSALSIQTVLPGFLHLLPDYRRLLELLPKGKPIAISGLNTIHRAHLAAGLARDTGRPIVLLCPEESDLRTAAEDLSVLTGASPALLAARDFLFHEGTVSRDWEHRRLAVFRLLRDNACPLLVASAEGMLQRTLPPERFDAACLTLAMGEEHPLDALARTLVDAGYTRCEQVEGCGQFAIRGGILDLCSPGEEGPVRIDFWGDEIDSIARFDIASQRRTDQIPSCRILPAREVPGGGADSALPEICPEFAAAADYLPDNALVLLCDTVRFTDTAKDYAARLGQQKAFSATAQELCRTLARRGLLYLDAFPISSLPVPAAELLAVNARQLPGFGHSLTSLENDLKEYQLLGYAVTVLLAGRQQEETLQESLRQCGIPSAIDTDLGITPSAGQILLAAGGLSAGFDYPDAKVAVFAPGTAAAPRHHRSVMPSSNRQKLASFTDLVPGDLVVHEQHGIGRFVCMTQMTVDGRKRDYIKLQFAGSDVLYVPAFQLDLISKYIGGGGDASARRLSKLGGGEWERAKHKARTAAKDMAKDLIRLYAERQRLAGYAFSPDTPWQQEFEEQFPYPETEDQIRCAEEIKHDMEKSTPMDRLLCGDVGYGKTEVAFRAVMKCVLDGKQAAILVPTTVLARQHYLTASRRFSGFPVAIELLSRSRTAAQSREILRRVAEGKVDLLIGTHRLLSKALKFRDLGLLVVDEEQRFGVGQKEKLKQIAKQVDVLTLSATPIPRTLNMAMSGLRDMSVLEQPPAGRQPVQTFVIEHDWAVLTEAIRKELARGGQVYYLYNRTGSIETIALRLRSLLGEEVRVATAHGRMPPAELERVMGQMAEGEIDILVCTTIIETGVDLPNVNTLIIENADMLGLSQLHQLRGRVGRSARRASAYMTFRKGRALSEDQAKRLAAIRDYAAFGAGFKIAMRDLEIRGAGNLLGAEQAGFLSSVGYDLYLRLLEEAVLEEQGKPLPQRTDCSVELPVAASLPESYVPAAAERMDLYRRIARIRTQADYNDMLDELIDRYGEPPAGAVNLLRIALLRTAASAAGITEITRRDTLLCLTLPEPDLKKVGAVCALEQYRGRLLFSAGKKPALSLRLPKNIDILDTAVRLIADFAALAAPADQSAQKPIG